MASEARRLASNAPGAMFVDDSCIDCGACRWIAPASFDADGDYSRVYRQPEGEAETAAALRALVSCPTASIGDTEKRSLRPTLDSFPYPMLGPEHPRVLHCGYHSEDSFGATAYLVVRDAGNVLVDSPRFTRGLVRQLEQLGGVATMFLTHRDDVADHAKFRDKFGCERVIHARDVRPSTRGAERVLEGEQPVALADDLLVIPTPGHTPGSACLLVDDTYLFTGDHLAWSMSMKRVYAFRGACWYDWGVQIESMKRLAEHRFEHILPGHSAPCSFPADEMRRRMADCIEWMIAKA